MYTKVNPIFKKDDNKKPIIGNFVHEEVEYLKDNEWSFYEKMDGTLVVVYWDHKKQQYDIEISGSVSTKESVRESFISSVNMSVFEEIFSDKDISLSFECFTMNNGKEYYKRGIKCILLDAKVGSIWLKESSLKDIASKLDIRVAPLICKCTLMEAVDAAKSGFISAFGDFMCEGVIGYPSVRLSDRLAHRIRVKIENKDFLQDEKEE